MKALKIIGWIVGILVLLIVVLPLVTALLLPKDYQVERSIVIDAPYDTVMTHVQYFEHFEKWSPWADLDPDMIVSITGTDGEVGAVYRWEGNEDARTGEMEITGIDPDRIDLALRFFEPWESTADVWYLLESLDNEHESVRITWGMKGSMPIPFNLLMLVQDFDEMIGEDYSKGLEQLKAHTEALAAVPE